MEKAAVTLTPTRIMTANEHINIASMKPKEVGRAAGHRGVCIHSSQCLSPRVSVRTPVQIVDELDKYIIGQPDAKRAVAIALRNRWRRMQLGTEMRGEVIPKNILMVGPTGVGKTEIARRLAKIARAPFVKVEATKFTEVGYHGRDVDTIIRSGLCVCVWLRLRRGLS